MMARVHIVVRGRVQGVGYRYFIARRATPSGIGGFVRNLVDGGVEIDAVGERQALEDLIREARTGPRAAQVTDVIVEWLEPSGGPASFTIR